MEEPRSIGSHLSERVRRYREALGLRQEDLADRTAQLGYPMNRVTLAKIEKGGTRADNASLVDVLVLAAALNVPPPLLFLPLGEAEQVAVTLNGSSPTSKFVAHPHVVFDWISGEDDLRSVMPWPTVEQWFSNSQPVRLHRTLRDRQDAVAVAAHRLAEAAAVEGGAEAMASAQARFDRALVALDAHREAYREAMHSVVLPDLPAEWAARLAELDEDH